MSEMQKLVLKSGLVGIKFKIDARYIQCNEQNSIYALTYLHMDLSLLQIQKFSSRQYSSPPVGTNNIHSIQIPVT